MADYALREDALKFEALKFVVAAIRNPAWLVKTYADRDALLNLIARFNITLTDVVEEIGKQADLELEGHAIYG